ncbi:MAG: hypothetical protein H0U74_21360 [Bradymonadaceae bacterium]|nr:hypothetical protein [Lujinxingiaceae bacterium]
MIARPLLLLSFIIVLSCTGCYAYGGHALASSEEQLRRDACEAHRRNDPRAYQTLVGRLDGDPQKNQTLCAKEFSVEQPCPASCQDLSQ